MGKDKDAQVILWVIVVLSTPGLLMCLWSLLDLCLPRMRVILPRVSRRAWKIIGAGIAGLLLFALARSFLIPRNYVPAASDEFHFSWSENVELLVRISIGCSVVAAIVRLILQPLRARKFYLPVWLALLCIAAAWSYFAIVLLAVALRWDQPGWGGGIEGLFALMFWTFLCAPALPLFFTILSAYPRPDRQRREREPAPFG